MTAPAPPSNAKTVRPSAQPDSEVQHCPTCDTKFKFFGSHRHHCRYCGKIYCSACCGNKVYIPELQYGLQKQIVCNGCFKEYFTERPDQAYWAAQALAVQASRQQQMHHSHHPLNHYPHHPHHYPHDPHYPHHHHHHHHHHHPHHHDYPFGMPAGGYMVNGAVVYWNGQRVDAGLGFQDLGWGYAKDNFHVFYAGRRMEGGATSMGFEALGEGYAKDNFHVYYMGNKSEASTMGFRVTGGGYAQDNFHTYFQGQRVH